MVCEVAANAPYAKAAHRAQPAAASLARWLSSAAVACACACSSGDRLESTPDAGAGRAVREVHPPSASASARHAAHARTRADPSEGTEVIFLATCGKDVLGDTVTQAGAAMHDIA
jgi:hypothetical protein